MSNTEQTVNIHQKSNIHLSSVCILTIFNLWLTFRLLNIHNCTYNTNETITKSNQIVKETINTIATANILKPIIDSKQKHINDTPHTTAAATITSLAFSDINFYLGRWDNQRLYKYFDFALTGYNVEIFQNSLICLATQSSIERLNFLPEVANNWNNQISIAVFVVGDEEFKILQIYVTYLKQCFESINSNVNFHVAVPKDRIPTSNYKKNTIDLLKNIHNCAAPSLVLKNLLKNRTVYTTKYRIKNVYPQNHLRNLARKGCQSENVFLTDVDIIPNNNLGSQLETFFTESRCKKLCAFVIPTYEIDTRAKFPKSKKELIRLEKKGLARPFHEKVFIYNQYATNFSKWRKDDSSDQDISVSYNVTNFEFLYEPFYVASDKVPIHDERFLGYGFTRNSQVYEMFLAGYLFQVLTPAFTCHWGLQQKKHRPAWREQQNNMNRIKFESFKKEILVKYRNVTISISNKNKPK